MELDGNDEKKAARPRTMDREEEDEGIKARTVITSTKEMMRNMIFQNLEFRRRINLAAFSSSSSIVMQLFPLGGADRIPIALVEPVAVPGGIHNSM